jgi:dTDP-4-amino-4,6-dideoxy-D-glucose/dTDP-4-amino-2,4-dideoxy-beta-L-xylose transaminase
MIPLFKVFMAPGVEIPLKETLYSGFIGQGKKVDEFESLLMQRFQTNNVLTVNSGTSGLHLLLRLAKDQVGDCEVLTSPLTCTATNWPILANGLKIKWVDVDQSCNMDLDDLERKLSPTTKIIMLVHWGGNPINITCFYDVMLNCYKLYGYIPIIIQDCAHAIGSKFGSKNLNHYFPAMYSFQAIKHFTAGDGGCICTEENWYKKAKLLRWYGIDREIPKADFRCEADIADWGYKFHMNDINATIGIHNFPFIDEVVNKHRENSDYYNSFDIPGITKIIPHPIAVSSQWIHTIHVEHRDDFARMMKEKGIMTSRVHERNDKHSCVAQFKTELPGVDKCVQTMTCIPNGWWVTNEEREYIVDCMKKGW